jgi:hypothetical protein
MLLLVVLQAMLWTAAAAVAVAGHPEFGCTDTKAYTGRQHMFMPLPAHADRMRF